MCTLDSPPDRFFTVPLSVLLPSQWSCVWLVESDGKPEEDTRPAPHIHPSVPSVHDLLPLYLIPVCPFSVPALTCTLSQFLLSPPLLLLPVPDGLTEPSVVKLTLRWTGLWLFAHAGRHPVENTVKVMSWSTARTLHCCCSRCLNSCSGVWKETLLPCAKKEISFKKQPKRKQQGDHYNTSRQWMR